MGADRAPSRSGTQIAAALVFMTHGVAGISVDRALQTWRK